jgi:hypothetical protein
LRRQRSAQTGSAHPARPPLLSSSCPSLSRPSHFAGPPRQPNARFPLPSHRRSLRYLAHTFLAAPAFSDESYRDDSPSPAISSHNPGASKRYSSAVGPLPAAAALTGPFRYSTRSNAAI